MALKRIDRYIGGDFLKAFAFSLAAFAFIWLLMDAVDKSRIESEQPKIHLYLYLLFTIPRIVVQILPAALMFAVCFTVSQFTVSREMVAIFSAGWSFYRAIASLLLIAAAASALLFVFSNFVVTPSNELANEQEELYKRGTKQATVQNVIFQKNLRGVEGYYFLYYLDRDQQRILGGFNYLETGTGPDDEPDRMLQAQSAQYDSASGEWILENGREVVFGDMIQEVRVFEEMRVRFPDEYDFFASQARNPNEMNVFALADEIDRLERLGFDSAPYQVQFHSSMSFPLMCIILAIVGSIAGNMGSLRSGGPLVRAILISTIAIFVYYLAFSLGESMGANGVIHPAMAAWGPTSFFFAAALFLMWRYRR